MQEYIQAVSIYHEKWQKLVAERQNAEYFEALKPTSLGWKVFDRAELLRRFEDLREQCDQIHFGWVNERWIVTMHLKKDNVLPWDLRVIKLVERRPGSTDAVGLDHLDFYAAEAEAVLKNETDLKWSPETNGGHCKWLSVWFDGTEAKLRADTVLQICADEMLECQKDLLK